MRRELKSAVAIALGAVTAAPVLPADVSAGPLTIASGSAVEMTAPVDVVHYRRHYRRYYYRRYGYDPSGAIFAAAALGIMGAGIAAASRPYYYGWGYPAYYGWGYPGAFAWGYPAYYGWGW